MAADYEAARSKTSISVSTSTKQNRSQRMGAQPNQRILKQNLRQTDCRSRSHEKISRQWQYIENDNQSERFEQGYSFLGVGSRNSSLSCLAHKTTQKDNWIRFLQYKTTIL